MINKLFVAFMVGFGLAAILAGIMEGGGGIATTQLTADHTAAVVTLNVKNTAGFLSSDYVIVANEKIRYTGKTATTFTGLTRGWDGTTATTHNIADKVYSDESQVINSALGFNIASTGSTVGALSIPTIIGNLFFHTAPKLIIWDFNFLKEGQMTYVRYLLLMISTGFVITFALTVASALGGVMQSIFIR